MQHVKTIKRHNGTTIKIYVFVEVTKSMISYHSQVGILLEDEIEYIDVCDGLYTLDHKMLPKKERRAAIEKQILKFVTSDELKAALKELWQKLKPA